MPLSTRRVSTTTPSMLMNSVAKVTSADSFASSFMASSRASMLCDWIRSTSWRAAPDWEAETAPVTHLPTPPLQGLSPAPPHRASERASASPEQGGQEPGGGSLGGTQIYRGDGQLQDGPILNVTASLEGEETNVHSIVYILKNGQPPWRPL